MRTLAQYFKAGLIVLLTVLIELEENAAFRMIYKNYLDQIDN